MKIKILMLVLLVVPFSLQAYSPVEIKTKTWEKPDYYPSITTISTGPIKWMNLTDEDYRNPEEAIEGVFYRAVVITEEIYSTLFIEKITRGPEGCCVKLRSIKMVDMYDFQDKFGLRGEISGLKVIGWDEYNTVKFTIHDRNFRVYIKGEGIKIEEYVGS